MVNYCNVRKCHNRSDKQPDRSFYRLPAIVTNQGSIHEDLCSQRRRRWLANIGQDFIGKNLGNIRICSDHFISGKPAALYDNTNPDWAPTLKMGNEDTPGKSMKQKADGETPELERFKRRKNREEQSRNSDAARSLLLLGESVPEQNDSLAEYLEPCTETQTEITGDMIDAMTDDLRNLHTENTKMKEKEKSIHYRCSQSDFEGKNDKVRYFSGLPSYEILMTLFLFLEPYLPIKKTLSKFQAFMLTLMRLRLNLPISFLSYEFGISPATASRIFSDVIDVMYTRMKPLVAWPSREELRKTMPMQFRKHFGNKCAVIIDCFEVFIERPTNLRARAETWSSYKHHNTVKFLIGITPQGSVSFISKAWGGRASDKFVTEHCGFLDLLLPGDVILADRGFDIQDAVGRLMAEAKIPAFTKGKEQLSPLDVEATRRIASVRIHVERVIGLVRQKYTILEGTLPLDLLICKEHEDITAIDKIALVCSALVNLCDSVVDFN